MVRLCMSQLLPVLNAKLIIQSGIKRVVYGEKYRLDDGIQLLLRAGVNVEFLDMNEIISEAKS